jgi:hypothetical protein
VPYLFQLFNTQLFGSWILEAMTNFGPTRRAAATRRGTGSPVVRTVSPVPEFAGRTTQTGVALEPAIRGRGRLPAHARAMHRLRRGPKASFRASLPLPQLPADA